MQLQSRLERPVRMSSEFTCKQASTFKTEMLEILPTQSYEQYIVQLSSSSSHDR